MRIAMTMMAAGLVLAGCNNTAPSNEAVAAADNAADAATDNLVASDNYQASVLALPIGQRNLVFIRAIQDAKLPCESVTDSIRVADQNGNPTWRAECGKNNAHLVSITKDGTANIISRSDR
jgi:uncharacterized lipoprotein NlpE involved in copper resistance